MEFGKKKCINNLLKLYPRGYLWEQGEEAYIYRCMTMSWERICGIEDILNRKVDRFFMRGEMRELGIQDWKEFNEVAKNRPVTREEVIDHYKKKTGLSINYVKEKVEEWTGVTQDSSFMRNLPRMNCQSTCDSSLGYEDGKNIWFITFKGNITNKDEKIAYLRAFRSTNATIYLEGLFDGVKERIKL